MSDQDTQNQKEPISIYQVIMIMIEQMSSVAWQKLGLQHDVVTGQIEKKLDEAKVAIDVITELTAHLESQLDENDKRQIHSLLRDLKMNYVEQSK